MKAAKIKIPKGCGRLSTPAERNTLARKIKSKTRTWAKKTLRGL